MPHSGRRALPLLAAALSFACEGPPPEQVRVELPEVVWSPDPVHVTVHARRSGAATVATGKLDLAVAPPDVAAIDKNQNLSCAKSGDASVTASIQGVKSAPASVKCRLVERLDVPSPPLFDLANPPVTLHVRPLSKSGSELDDVPVTMTTESPSVLSVTGETLTPLAVGETSVNVNGGGKSAKFQARVVRTLHPEPLPLEGGHRIYFGLPEGKYEVELVLPLEKEVKIEWRGAPYCAYQGRGKSHVSTCVLQGKGGAVIDNPTYLTTGGTQVGTAGVTIREVP
jgi:hypothetical protein